MAIYFILFLYLLFVVYLYISSQTGKSHIDRLILRIEQKQAERTLGPYGEFWHNYYLLRGKLRKVISAINISTLIIILTAFIVVGAFLTQNS